MDPQTVGLIGALVGSSVGVLGGVIGTYFSIKNTHGPRERAFTIKAAVVSWAAIVAFLAALWLIPSPYRHFLWLPYALLLPWGIRVWNRRQEQIRREESGAGA
jgi:hypothetical protein